jgi:hypothetical protein
MLAAPNPSCLSVPEHSPLPALEGYAVLELSLGGITKRVVAWVSLSESAVLDFGDCVELDTGNTIPWQVVEATLSSEGTTFEQEFHHELLLQAQTFGLYRDVASAIASDRSREPPGVYGPGLRRALPRTNPYEETPALQVASAPTTRQRRGG